MKYTLADLQKEAAAKAKLKYVFFWGHTPKSPGHIGSECLSQFYPSKFKVDGETYHWAEQWMMTGKAALFGDNETRQKILGARSPAECKKLGRKVYPFDAVKWDEAKYEIVKAGNVLKFAQNEKLKAFLTTTGKKILVEASPYDKIWGIGMAADDDKATNPLLWKGENLLGFALMEVRDEL